MAPAVVEVAAGSAAKEFKKESAYARLLGSGQEEDPVLPFGEEEENLIGREINRLRWDRRTRHIPPREKPPIATAHTKPELLIDSRWIR